ncbi:MAG: hypothetical protein QOF49_2162 [Chloroflexota bacterium]|jgi:predicted dehydrogenase|nr:hypothetical protein [Chloroflexota bacterium]
MTGAAGTVVGLGIVGCGGAAADVVRAVKGSPVLRVVAVHDVVRDRAVDLAAGTDARVHRRLDGLVGDPAVDAVYIALPHDRLVRAAVAVLEGGRHVLVEKPLSIDAAGLRAVRDAGRRAGRSVGVMYELRQVASARQAGTLIRDGAIGAVRLVRIRTLIDKPPSYWISGPTGRVADPWRARRARSGGGVVIMNAIHQLDLVRFLTGLEVIRASAEAEAGVAGADVEDVASASLRFDNGAIASLVASAHAPGATGEETIDIDGTDGALRLGDPYAARPRLALYLRGPYRDHPVGRWIAIRPPPVDPWAATLDAFARAIADGTPPVPGLDDAEAALATVLAIYRSAATGRVVRVHRSWDPSPADGAPRGTATRS